LNNEDWSAKEIQARNVTNVRKRHWPGAFVHHIQGFPHLIFYNRGAMREILL